MTATAAMRPLRAWQRRALTKYLAAKPQDFLAVATPGAGKTTFGLRVDSFVLEWWPTAGPGRPAIAQRYLENRGYWDDLWSRRRSTDEREDSMPRVGYLEVIIDGYI